MGWLLVILPSDVASGGGWVAVDLGTPSSLRNV